MHRHVQQTLHCESASQSACIRSASATLSTSAASSEMQCDCMARYSIRAGYRTMCTVNKWIAKVEVERETQYSPIDSSLNACNLSGRREETEIVLRCLQSLKYIQLTTQATMLFSAALESMQFWSTSKSMSKTNFSPSSARS